MTDGTKGWGGKRAGAGRPSGTKGSYKAPEQIKNKRIVVLCTEEQDKLLKERAQNENMAVSAYILKKVLG